MTRPPSSPRWIDISAPVAPGLLPSWPGAPPVAFTPRLRLANGDNADDTTITVNLHTGTHVDAPSHFIAGAATNDALSLDTLIGECVVADLRGHRRVTAGALDGANVPAGTERLLLLTDNSAGWAPEFDESFVGVSLDGAQWLVDHDVKLIGNDYLSVQPYGESDEVHRTILAADIVIVEGLQLGGVAPGRYWLACLPVRLVGTEGAPARAVLAPIEETP